MLPFNRPIKSNKRLEKDQKNIFKKTGCNFMISKIFKSKKTYQKDDDNLTRDIQIATHVSQTKHAESSRNTSGVDGFDVPGTIILAKFGCITESEKQNHCNSNIEPYVINED